eukprot:scaffold195612_cov18-Tisochrysis_lutea.AAC.1
MRSNTLFDPNWSKKGDISLLNFSIFDECLGSTTHIAVASSSAGGVQRLAAPLSFLKPSSLKQGLQQRPNTVQPSEAG